MCHCAPVFKIHSAASTTWRVGIGLRPGRLSGTFSSGKCSRIRSHCSSRRSNTQAILRHYMRLRDDLEIGSDDLYYDHGVLPKTWSWSSWVGSLAENKPSRPPGSYARVPRSGFRRSEERRVREGGRVLW